MWSVATIAITAATISTPSRTPKVPMPRRLSVFATGDATRAGLAGAAIAAVEPRSIPAAAKLASDFRITI